MPAENQSNCPLCNKQFDSDERGRPRRISLMQMRGKGEAPVSTYVCRECWSANVRRKARA